MADSPVNVLSKDEGSSGITDTDSEREEANGRSHEKTDGGFWRNPGTWIRRRSSDFLFSGMQGVLDIYASSDILHGETSPYPVEKIQGGPRPGEKVAIIGCGPSGAYMAKKLQAMGCHVTVLEKESIGGKAHSRRHRGATHEMGACYMSSDYETVYQLLQEYDMTGQYNIARRAIWTEETKDVSCELKEWFYSEAKKAVGEPDASNAWIASEIFMDTIQYISHHRRLLTKYESTDFLPPRPSPEHLRELQMPIAEFLNLHDLRSLKPLFMLAYSIQGYGFIEEEPLLYGMLWVTPKLINGLIEMLKVQKNLKRGSLHARPKESGPPKAITMLAEGFQTLVERMVHRCQEAAAAGTAAPFTLEQDINITKVVRSDDGVEIEYHREFINDYDQVLDQPARTEKFDFLVLAAPAQQILPMIDAREDEKALFGTLRESTFITTLVDYKPAKSSQDSIDSYPDNMYMPFKVYASRDTHQVMRETGHAVELEDESLGTMVTYQFSAESIHNDSNLTEEESKAKVLKEREDAENELKTHLARIGKTHERLEQHRFRYFPRHSREAIGQGVLWDIFEMQGKYRTWFTGAAVCFEAINAIVEYNDQLLLVWDRQQKDEDAIAAGTAADGTS